MAWKKTTSNYVADWKVFSLTKSSIRQVSVIGLVLGILWGVAVVKIHGLPGDERRAVIKNDAQHIAAWWSNAATPNSKATPSGSCQKDYQAWGKLPEGPQKASKLVYWKKAYGTLNFHDKCVGEPRHVSAAEAIQ